MKLMYLVGIPFLLQGCMLVKQNLPSSSRSDATSCLNSGRLTNAQINSLDLSQESKQVSITVDDKVPIGYTFSAKAGYELNYSDHPDLCIIVSDPETRRLTGSKITKDGNHIMEIRSRGGIKNLVLSIELINPNQIPPPTPIPTPSPIASQLEPYSVSSQPVLRPRQAASSSTQTRDPLNTFQTYFTHIERGNTSAAWNYLSPGFRVFWQDFNRYQTFWNGFRTVSISSPRIVGQTTNAVWIEANVVLVRPSGTTIDNPDNRFYMGWDRSEQDWKFITSPRQFIVQYFQTINRGDYRTAWESLSPEFIGESTWNEYNEWWNSVAEVEIGNTEMISYLQDQANVKVDLAFIMRNGRRSMQSITYGLRLSPDTLSWKFIRSVS